MTTKPFYEDGAELEREHEKALSDFDKKHGFEGAPNDNGKNNGKGRKGNGKGSKQPNQEQKQVVKEEYTQKYSYGNTLMEAVIIGNKPLFTVIDSTANLTNIPELAANIAFHKGVQLDEKTVFRPLESTSYINKPYYFKSEKEFDECIEKAKHETLDTLYRRTKSIWKKYIDADDFHLSICAADTIFSYFQDKIGMTHYLFFVGGNGSGKSNNLSVFHFLAYRNMTSSDITAANIYQFLGSRDEGVGTICEDEADGIDEDRTKMGIYKNGYTTGFPITRTDTSFGRHQNKFNTFCFKAFAAERLPDSMKAKGFKERTLEMKCAYGIPKHDIIEVANPAGDGDFQELLDELNEMRNTLLCYRLIHYHETIPNIPLNIHNREKQLFKPVLRVFQGTETLDELLPVISEYVSQKRKSDTKTLHSFLYQHIKRLIQAQNTTQLGSSLIWNSLKDVLESKDIPNKPQSCETVEFGVISQKEIVSTLQEVFGATSLKTREGRYLLFDILKLNKLDKIYNVDLEIKVVTHVTHVTHVGLDRHIENGPKHAQTDDKKDVKNTVQDSQNVSQASQASQTLNPKNEPTEHEDDILAAKGMYRTGGKWGCPTCKVKLDYFWARDHICNGKKKESDRK
jgi:hypothetical protein